jgi:hypothetical protein
VAIFTKYDIFAEDLSKKVHTFFGTTDTLKALLSNTAPNKTTHTVRAQATELAAGHGYPAGGVDIQNVGTRTGAVVTVTAVDAVIAASGGDIGPFRYVIIYNDSSPSDSLIGWIDRGASILLPNGGTVTINFGALLFTVQ